METERLLLRQWRQKDAEPFAALNADPRVMAHFPSVYSRSKSDEGMAQLAQEIDQLGWSFWATEHKQSGDFIGFIGLRQRLDGLPFSPCVEIGWRLSHAYWGQGLATEGALASLEYAFTSLELEEVVSMTTTTNTASERVMQKLGMHKAASNFMHPELPQDHILCEHVLYRLSRGQWLADG